MEMHTFFREMFITNLKQMDIYATNAKILSGKNELDLYDTFGHIYDEIGDITSSMKADRAIVDQRSLYTKLYTNVILKSSNDTRLYTDYIEWDNDRSYFTTDYPVRVEQADGSWLTGVGMEGDMNLENIIVYNEEDEGFADSFPME